MNNFSPKHYSPASTQFRTIESEWRFVIYSLLIALSFSLFISQIGLSDFSSLDEDYLSPFVVDQRLEVSETVAIIQNNSNVESSNDIPVYHYNAAVPFNPSVDLARVSELSRSEFREMIVLSTPSPLRARINKHIDIALAAAEKHQVDPFWVLAIMWTESHFNDQAKSFVSANGLMQIMPETSIELSRKLRFSRNPRVAVQLTMKPRYNVEMGAYYLKYLQKRFWHSPTLATVAYNMGPGWVKWRMRNNKKVGNRNHYLNKVSSAYQRLTSRFQRYTLHQPRAFTQTYVAMNPPVHESYHESTWGVGDISSL